MTNDEVISTLRSAKVKVILYVSGLFILMAFVDFYLVSTSVKTTQSMLSNSPFSIVIFVCLQLAIMLTFTYLEKILVGINKINDSADISG
ncbi:hypothetical protein [Pseudoalteromonas sp. Z9A4]|uniref:hypothetical protein n=1 Tax=Pseudoalteromonas sp. Z9A4 TaxID=2686353 RepID=UPI00140A08C1|nr:hypothetical protein [Pseudoalteromonas sp. Z9A4]